VIDGGNAAEILGDPYTHWGGVTDVYYTTMTADQTCVNELVRIGIEPQAVSYVLFSHLHLDHTGAAWPKFKQSPEYYE
jgi:N-acyl homoserine lactone hydrolase